MDDLLSHFVQGIMLGGVYALIALGVVVIAKASKVFNIAHGEIMMMLAFVAWWLMVRVGLPTWAAILLVLLFGILLALTLERFAMRPLIGRSMLIPFVVTLVLGIAIKGVTTICFGNENVAMPNILPRGSVNIGNTTLSYTLLVSFIISTVMFIAFVAFFRYTKIGLAMRSVAEDQVVSQSIGLDVKMVFAVSWIIGSLSAAASGILLSTIFVLDASVGEFAIMRALPVILLGGVESIPGAFVGALIIGVVETLSGAYIDPHVTAFREVLPFLLMIVILIIRPHGLFGLKQIRRI